MNEDDRETFRATFAGIIQGRCENCGDCDEDCPCDATVDELVNAVERIIGEHFETQTKE
ncbi:MAG: hypothetical protein ABL907_11645 [Hyphomicrobium sp.]